MARTVTGEIVLPPGDYPAPAAELVVQVEDISRADAPSVMIGEFRRRNVPLRGGETIRFRIEIPADRIDERRLYSVRAHADMSGSGHVKKGDLLTTRSYPVLTHGHGDHISVAVQRI